ncbi:MAG: regulatory iron-sulfur-containing complex subunit RicT [Patescibacteria group bacterium]|jgi:cell fate regulator YaaT (PSP1 superfamily)
MKVALVQFTTWDKAYYFDPAQENFAVGDFVIVETQIGIDMGKIIGFEDIAKLADEAEIKPITRKATKDDLKKRLSLDEEKEEAVKNCKKMVTKYALPMKLVDAHFSFDDKRITFAFIAQGRIDFRELVKDLSRYYKKNIRLQQLGIRDEMKMCGDIGPCGMQLCCQTFVKELGSITSDLAEAQQVVHRGSERLSGCCGRLRCCLAFEKEVYRDLAAKMPPLGSIVKTESGKGEVVGWRLIKQMVDVRVVTDNGKEKEVVFIEVPVDKISR